MINTPKYDGGLHLGLLDQKMRTHCLQTLKPWMDIEYGSVSKGIQSFHATLENVLGVKLLNVKLGKLAV